MADLYDQNEPHRPQWSPPVDDFIWDDGPVDGPEASPTLPLPITPMDQMPPPMFTPHEQSVEPSPLPRRRAAQTAPEAADAEAKPSRVQRMRDGAVRARTAARKGRAMLEEFDDRLQRIGRANPATFEKVRPTREAMPAPQAAAPEPVSMSQPQPTPDLDLSPLTAQTPSAAPSDRDVRVSYDAQGRPVLSRQETAAETPTFQPGPAPDIDQDYSH
jgi:hypothetical protein